MNKSAKLEIGGILKLSKFHYVRRTGENSYIACVVDALGTPIESKFSTLEKAIEQANKDNDEVLELGRTIVA